MKRKLAIISGIVLLVAGTYTATSTLACASDEKYCQEISTTPTLPIPSDEYLPNITPTTVENEPTVTCEGGDTYLIRQECMETTPTITPVTVIPTEKPSTGIVSTPTPSSPDKIGVQSEPTAGQSATVAPITGNAVMPTKAPMTGKRGE